MKKYTWDEIYEKAIGTSYGDYELKVKDNAREQTRWFAIEHGNEDLEKAEIPEEMVERYCDIYGLFFDGDGNIIESKNGEENKIVTIDFARKIRTIIHGEYSDTADITFILEEKINLTNNEYISTEVVGFYYGQPDLENTKRYIGKIKAEY